MKEVYIVKSLDDDGENVRVSLREDCEHLGEAKIANIEVRSTAKSNRAFYIGRRVSVEIKPL